MRQRREELGVSQGRLGRHLGLTFSQVQKYEKGSNRIGAGRLYQISRFLGVSPLYFYEGLEGADEWLKSAGPERPSVAGSESEDLAALNAAFATIRDAETRRSVLALVKSLTAGGTMGSRRAD